MSRGRVWVKEKFEKNFFGNLKEQFWDFQLKLFDTAVKTSFYVSKETLWKLFVFQT